MASLENAIDSLKPLSSNAEISARTSVLVVVLCWIGILTEGYEVGVLGAILPALATDPN
jgi:AAHS family benzoate transporter-like MFS transporter